MRISLSYQYRRTKKFQLSSQKVLSVDAVLEYVTFHEYSHCRTAEKIQGNQRSFSATGGSEFHSHDLFPHLVASI